MTERPREAVPSTVRRVIASVIGGVGGAVYVLVNAAALGAAASTVLRVAAVAALAVILGRAWSLRDTHGPASARRGFGRGYWLIVVLEVVLIFGGRTVIAGPLHAPDAVVAWLSLIVGVHFFAFVALWHKPLYAWLGTVITASAIVAFVLVGAAASAAAVAVFSAIIPGVALLAFGLYGVWAGPAATARRGQVDAARPHQPRASRSDVAHPRGGSS
jgi:hypothetical protein